MEGATAGEKEDRIDRREQERQMGNIGARRPSVSGLPGESIRSNTENDIPAEETGEEHRLGDQENDHPEFASGGWCSLVFLGIVSECCCRHSWLWFFKLVTALGADREYS